MKKIVCLLMVLSVVLGLGITAFASDDDPRIILQDGQGNEEVVMFQGLYTLPECSFTAPDGQRFKCWRVDDRKDMMPGEQVYTDYRTVITAVWEPLPVVTFEADGGDGTMETVATEGEYALPECSFTAPEGQQFKCWLVNGEEKQVGDTVTVEADMTVTAAWEELPAEEITVSEDVTTSDVQEDREDEDRTQNEAGEEPEEFPWVIVVVVAVAVAAVAVVVTLLVAKKKKA